MKFTIRINQDGSRSAIFHSLGNAEAKIDLWVTNGVSQFECESMEHGVLHSGGKVYLWEECEGGYDWRYAVGIAKPRTRPKYERIFVQQKSKALEIHPDYRAGAIEAVKGGMAFSLVHKYSPKMRRARQGVRPATIA